MLKPEHLGNSHTNHLQAARGQTLYIELTLQPAKPLILIIGLLSTPLLGFTLSQFVWFIF